MAHLIREKQWQATRNLKVTVVVFDFNGRRVHTHGGCSYLQAIEEAMAQSRVGRTCTIVPHNAEGKLEKPIGSVQTAAGFHELNNRMNTPEIVRHG